MSAVIYKITHIESGRCYVGHTSNDANYRFAEHRRLLFKRKHHSPYLQHAWDKYGEAQFVFGVIERCDIGNALSREQHFINTLTSVFNYAKVAGTRRGVPQPPEAVERLRKSMLGNSYTKGRAPPDDEKERRAASCRGKTRSPEQRARMAAAMRGVPHPKAVGHVVSEATREKIRIATDATRPTMHGKHHSAETRKRISDTNKATIAAKGHPSLGQKRSAETKARMCAAQRARFATP